MRIRLIFLVLLLARTAAAQTPDTTRRAPNATVRGFVHDSLAHTPLAGAVVQLVPASGVTDFVRTATSDSTGMFILNDVPEGFFVIGFFHPMLDSLGVEPPLHKLYIYGARTIQADLGIPAASRFRAAICGNQTLKTGAVLIGNVRDAETGNPIEGATVSGEWLEMSFRKNGVTHRVPRVVATTGKNGWFGLCNVPKSGTMMLMASRGADSTGRIEVEVPEEGFARRELYIGSSQTVFITDTTQSRVAAQPSPRPKYFGNGRLSGTVTALAGGIPLANAQVSIADGPQTRTNARGEWTITDAPTGTYMLEVRALGYYPGRRRVDVASTSTNVKVALSTLRAVLDTVRIRASRLNGANLAGFEERRRSGIGRYLTAADIARHRPVVVSDLFRNMPGTRIELDPNGVDYYIMVRGNAGEWCPATIYLDGLSLRGVTASDLDVWVRTHEVRAIEVYAGLGTPLEFQEGMSNCGSILIWTK